MKGMSISQKILAHNSGKSYVSPGEHITAKIDFCFSHDPVINVLSKKFYNDFGKDAKVWNSNKIALFHDHLVPAKNLESRNQIQIMDRFVEQQNIKHYYKYGGNYGVCHIIILEDCLIRPGQILIGTDSHTVTAGSFNTFSTGVGVFDLVPAMKTGELWFTVPDTIQVKLNGKMSNNICTKDVILKLLNLIKLDGAKNMCIEWTGEALEYLSLDERSTLCNMSVEAGATNSVMELNNESREYLKKVTGINYEGLTSDKNTSYARIIELDLDKIKPQVALPHRPDNVIDVQCVPKTKVHQVYVGGCTGGKLDDIKLFTENLGDAKVHPNTNVIVVPATIKIYLEMIKMGITEKLINAGAAVESPGCKACYGVQGGVTGDDENCLATINRNFIGRMGNPKSFIYLSSPITAAKSAITGYICTKD